jgi:hypothetical protein
MVNDIKLNHFIQEFDNSHDMHSIVLHTFHGMEGIILAYYGGLTWIELHPQGENQIMVTIFVAQLCLHHCNDHGY